MNHTGKSLPAVFVGLIAFSRRGPAFLREHGIAQVGSVDDRGHDSAEWRNNLSLFSSRIFR